MLGLVIIGIALGRGILVVRGTESATTIWAWTQREAVSLPISWRPDCSLKQSLRLSLSLLSTFPLLTSSLNNYLDPEPSPRVDVGLVVDTHPESRRRRISAAPGKLK